jgi:hypothetical protein
MMTDEKTLKALIDAGAIKKIHIIGSGPCFHVKADTQTGTITASTTKGSLKTWKNLDSTAKWIRALGIGTALVDFSKWEPNQIRMDL